MDTELTELAMEIESAAFDFLEATSIEELCNLFGAILHNIICPDDAISENMKAAYTVHTVATNLTRVAVGHFDTSDLLDRVQDLILSKHRTLH